jgi:two-component system, cell cycle sensor histidine kinase and response regulator CckA
MSAPQPMDGEKMGRALRLLLVEDQVSDAALLLDQLRRFGYDVAWERVETREAMAAALAAGSWDLVISDFSMPQFSAPEALALRHELGSDLPFLIVSGSIQEEDAVECLRQGADDFITKGRLARLGPAVERSLRESDERRARLLAEKRLQQAQKMEAIGQLAGGIAHDFNNLLGVILGYGELLSKDVLPADRRRKRVDEIMGAARRAAALTGQLLAFSRQQPVEARSLDLNAVVTGMASMLRSLIGEHVEVTTRLSEGLHLVRSNPGQIEQVLLNLAANARDAMSGGGRLIIETGNVDLDDMYVLSHPDASPGPHVLLTVSDTGHGMDAATVARVFEPFFTTKEPGKGTGLGLASVYGIVKASGGHVGIYSEPGRGTTFKIYLPRTEHAASAPPAPPGPEASRPMSSETVLLLEDESALRDVIREVLQEDGYTVIDGPEPEDAMAAAERHSGRIHLLLTDLVMPRLSGVQAAERVRAARPDVKILYMSGYTPAGAEHQAFLPEGHAYLQKPFSMDALLRKVRDTLESRP